MGLQQSGVGNLFFGMLFGMSQMAWSAPVPFHTQTLFEGEKSFDLLGSSLATVDQKLLMRQKTGPQAKILWIDGTVGTVVRTTKSTPDASQRFGDVIVALGDLDRDESSDVLVSDWKRGRVWIYSGRSGDLLKELSGPPGSSKFGVSADSIDDLNNDGTMDFVVVGQIDDRAVAWVYSGRNFRKIYEVQTHSSFGKNVKVFKIGDVNSDGTGDFALTDARRGVVSVRSGLTGVQIFELQSAEKASFFGQKICLLGDVDGDGVDDFVVSAPWSSVGKKVAAGRVMVYSGKTRTVLLEVLGERPYEQLGVDMSTVLDLDADGRADFLVVSKGTTSWNSKLDPRVRAYSSRTGLLVGEFAPGLKVSRLGNKVVVADWRGHQKLQAAGRVQILTRTMPR